MAVLPPAAPELFSVQQPASSKKMMQTPSNATVAAIAAGQNPSSPLAVGRPKGPRRTSSATSAAINRKDTQEKRANHNAIERARRDSLNQRFLVLASKIPSISEVRRPSKSLIVNRSMQFVSEALSREAYYRKMITDLNDRTRVLTEQLNEYRLANGLQNYVETVPELSLPVPMVDAPKDKPTARIVGRKGSSTTQIEMTDATDEYGLDEYDDGLDLSPSGLEDQVAFFSQPSIYAAAPEVPASMVLPQANQYANLTATGATYPPVHTPQDVNGTAFFQQPLAASPVTSSPASQPEAVQPSPSSSSPVAESTSFNSPMGMTHPPSPDQQLMANWNKMFSFNLPPNGLHAPPVNLTSADFASLLASPMYHPTS